ncbi:MAG: ABC transporter permease subunit [Streptosporangiales bacterium]|nr:ABC transporter permease subunit [Streptosporangiales bacterium]
MLGLIGRRLLVLLPLLMVISFLVFSLILLIPGDPAVALAGDQPDPKRIAEIREMLGLDQPFFQRYLDWLGAVLQGDLGRSLFTDVPVLESLATRLPVTLSLAALAVVFALLLGFAVGSLAALRPGGLLDRFATVAASAGIAVPYFWVGMALVSVFSLGLTWFPAVGYTALSQDPVGWLHHLAIPAIALGLAPAAAVARQARSAMGTVLRGDYIRTARAKGLGPFHVVVKHGMKNAAVPVVTVLGTEAARLIGGTVVMEQLFALPGIGQLAYQAVFNRDFPVVQGVVMAAAVGVLLINLIVDVSYGYFNPRIRQT